MPALSYTLTIKDAPAGSDLLEAIQQIEVEDHADMADMLRLRIAIGVNQAGSDWAVLDDDPFTRLTQLKLSVTVGSGPAERLIEAYVIETNADFSNQPGQSVLNVVAMDPTVLMHLEGATGPGIGAAGPAAAARAAQRNRLGHHRRTADPGPSGHGPVRLGHFG